MSINQPNPTITLPFLGPVCTPTEHVYMNLEHFLMTKNLTRNNIWEGGFLGSQSREVTSILGEREGWWKCGLLGLIAPQSGMLVLSTLPPFASACVSPTKGDMSISCGSFLCCETFLETSRGMLPWMCLVLGVVMRRFIFVLMDWSLKESEVD